MSKDEKLLGKLRSGIKSGEFTVKEDGSIKLNLDNPGVVKKIMDKAKGFSAKQGNS